jgi:glycosyltransferase involved in cell wall biosynthesis
VIQSIPKSLDYVSSIKTIVIDDGSRDKTSRAAKGAGAIVLRHRINRGVGVATMTGLAAAKRLGADIAVTMDADGQHDPTELANFITPIRLGQADIVVGTRLIDPKGMPLIRQVGNKMMNGLLQLLWGIHTTDSQSGYRAYGKKALNELHLTSGGFEVCTELLYLAKQSKLIVTEVPIKTIYSDYSKAKGQNPITAILTLMRFITRIITG